MYDNLKVQNGDLVFNALGQLELVNGEEAIIQNMLKRLNTYKGELFYNMEYGIDNNVKRLKMNNKSISDIQAFLNDALLADEKIDSVYLVNIRKTDKDGTEADIQIVLTDNTILNLNYQLI